jgi:hypothetical protein
VLADHVGGHAHLEIIQLGRHQVGLPVLDCFAGVGPEEKWLRRPLAGDRRLHVLPQRLEAQLRVMPADLVEDGVHLDICPLVDAAGLGWIVRRRRRTGEIDAGITAAGAPLRVGIGCARHAEAAVEKIFAGPSFRRHTIPRAGVDLHRQAFERAIIRCPYMTSLRRDRRRSG